MCELAHRAECQEGTEAERGCRVGIHQRVADEDAVLIRLEDSFLFQDNAANTICCRRYDTGIELTNVLVSVRTECVALILVEA